MSDVIGTISTPVGATPRQDGARPRDAHAADAAPVSFATLLGAALAPAARPLTRPVAAGTNGSAIEGSAAGETAEGGDGATVAGAIGAAGGGAVVGTPSLPTIVDAGGAAGTAHGGTANDGAANGGTAAAGAAAPSDAAARAAAAAHGIYRGTDALAPELRERLGRVVERMKAEHGHDVRITETFRTQARQDRLHAQGRTTDGPVVTWTRRSNHTLGRAADVIVNGTYGDRAAYATLHRIAREEGLHTLGTRDPGHLELPKAVPGRAIDLSDLARLSELPGLDGLRIEEVRIGVGIEEPVFAKMTTTPAQRGAASAPLAPVVGAAAVAGVAQVAQVAHVAVAQVAQVAQVATPGIRRAAPVARPSAPTGGAVTAAAGAGGDAARVGGTAGARRAAPFSGVDGAAVAAGRARTAHQGLDGDRAARAGGRGGRDEPVDAATLVAEPTYGATHARGEVPGTATVDVAERAARVETADHLARLDRIAALQESAAQRPLSHLTLTLDGAAGGTDRIRVGLRGASVGATLELSDAAQAEHLTARLGELQQALEGRGLEADALQVRRAGVSTEPGEMSRVASLVLEREALRSGASSSAQSQSQSQQQQQQQSQSQATPQRERDERSARDGSHEDPSSSRHRSRREHEEHTR